MQQDELDTNVQASPMPPARRTRSRLGSLVLVAALTATAIGGGVAGSAATLAAMGTRPFQVSTGAARLAPDPEIAPAASAATLRPAAAAPASSIADIYQMVKPSVVRVTTTRPGAADRFRDGRAQGQGTGFVVDQAGHVLTNNHVVAGSSRVTVVLADGTRRSAQVVGADPGSDLALLAADIPPSRLTPATLGDSSTVRPGDLAIAVGSPFGLDYSVTAGVISAIGRDYATTGGRPLRGLLQTDAPINPGNSGGPLFNVDGEVIGITTAIESPVRGSVGIGFAVPINAAKRLLPQLAGGQKVEHAWLGISGVTLTEDLAQARQLPIKQGVLVATVIPDGPAAKAGLRAGQLEGDLPVGGDIITALDGQPVQSIQDIASYVDSKRVGDTVEMTILRDGSELRLSATLAPWPAALQ